MANDFSADVRVYDTNGDPHDSNELSYDESVGGRVDVYSTGPTSEHVCAVTLVPDGNGGFTLTVYRDENVPLAIRTMDYFTTGTTSRNPDGSPRYTVLRAS
jgi:hypothetical protein